MSVDINNTLYELNNVKSLLFFLGETLDDIQQAALDYRKIKKYSDKMLAHDTDRSIDQLVSMQSIILEKVLDIEKGLDC